MKIVVVSGGFDPVHTGHIAYFKSAKQLGDKLIVALNSDEWLINKKGKLLVRSDRPDFFDEPPRDLPEVESNYHGELNFYAYEQRNKYDYSVSFNAKFSYGQLDAIELTEFEKHSNENRKSYQAEFKKQAEIQQIRSKKLWYKMYRAFYVKPIKYLFRTMYKVLSHLKSKWFMYESKLFPW